MRASKWSASGGMALPSPEVPPQALARVTVQAQALTLAPEASGYDAARTAYLSTRIRGS